MKLQLIGVLLMAIALRACGTAPVEQPPPPVIGVTHDTLRWDEVAGASVYRVYRAQCVGDVIETDRANEKVCTFEGSFSLLGNRVANPPIQGVTIQNSYVDETVQPGEKWTYYLTTVDEAGNESEPSKHLAVQIP